MLLKPLIRVVDLDPLRVFHISTRHGMSANPPVFERRFHTVKRATNVLPVKIAQSEGSRSATKHKLGPDLIRGQLMEMTNSFVV